MHISSLCLCLSLSLFCARVFNIIAHFWWTGNDTVSAMVTPSPLCISASYTTLFSPPRSTFLSIPSSEMSYIYMNIFAGSARILMAGGMDLSRSLRDTNRSFVFRCSHTRRVFILPFLTFFFLMFLLFVLAASAS